MNKLVDMQEALSNAKSLEELQTFVEGLRGVYGIDNLVYHSVNASGGQYAALTYSDEWVERYLDKGYERIDPVVQGCYKRFTPIDWKALDWSSKASRDFLGEAASQGLGNQGFSVPIRGPSGQFALFSVNQKDNDDRWAQFTEERASDLILIAHYMNERALEIEGGPSQGPVRALSPREKDALTLLALGNNRAGVAEALQISENTLRVYIESARFKMGATNTVHAVATALTHGLIVV